MASVLLVAAFTARAGADSTSSQEYQVKAAFLYNFLQFIDWPEDKSADNNQPLTIGIVGKDPFGDAFEPIKDKKVKDRSVLIKRFNSLEDLKKAVENNKTQPETCTKCHLLFICSSEQENLKEILNLVKDYNVLTVGEMKGFLEAGGIINFLVVENKIRFEINTSAAERAKLEIRSQLLRLAKRIVEEDAAQENKKAELSEKAGNN
ncbi:MAG: YfiR family protein [Phycisphaerae bacterium]|nr:YfiR family protein [Phycisphaerae bacterium]